MNKRDRVEGCDQYLQTLIAKRPFNTPGKWIRSSMLLVLAKLAGDMDPEGLAFCLGEPNVSTFVALTKMDGLEEMEAARLCLGAKGDGKEDNKWDDDEGESD